MKNLLAALSALAAILSFTATAQTLPTVAVPADIQRALDEYSRAWQANDPAALAELFAPEGMALPNGQPPARGAESIRKVYSQGAGSPLYLRPVAFASSGDLAYVVGGFGPGPGKPEFGKFTLVFQRGAAGRWLIVSDMDNSNVPMQPVPRPAAKPAGG